MWHASPQRLIRGPLAEDAHAPSLSPSLLAAPALVFVTWNISRDGVAGSNFLEKKTLVDLPTANIGTEKIIFK